jgi:PhnB protein
MAVQGSEWTLGAIVPHLAVRDLDQAVEFYQQAFGAEELYRSPATPELGEYASLRIWNSIVMVSADVADGPEKPELAFVASPERLGGTTCVFQVAVPDPDKVYTHAIESGGLPAMPLADMFWGDRYGWVRDPFGYVWAICSTNEIISAEENNRRMLAMRRKAEAR